VKEVKPRYHLFGHAHESNGIKEQGGIIFSNGAVLDDVMNLRFKPRVSDI
jgi:Icc-related predicted phosphoesterase